MSNHTAGDKIPKRIREAVKLAYGWRCVLCGAVGALDLHHVIPRAAGGESEVDNLVPLCSNHRGKQSCHYAVHVVYRARERRAGSMLAGAEYLEAFDLIREAAGVPVINPLLIPDYVPF